MEEKNRIFAKNLSDLVHRSGKKQNEIAKAMGFSSSTFNNWIKGHSMPTTGKLQVIADYFGVGKEYLIRDNTGIDFLAEGQLIEISRAIDPDRLERLLAYAKELKALYPKEK